MFNSFQLGGSMVVKSLHERPGLFSCPCLGAVRRPDRSAVTWGFPNGCFVAFWGLVQQAPPQSTEFLKSSFLRNSWFPVTEGIPGLSLVSFLFSASDLQNFEWSQKSGQHCYDVCVICYVSFCTLLGSSLDSPCKAKDWGMSYDIERNT